MIFMAKQDQGSFMRDKAIAEKYESVNSAVVTSSDGYTFGVWGISGDDDGTVRLNRDHELLAIDTALVLGEVQGQHAVDAELRFVPLRLGRLKVPNWKLYALLKESQRKQKWKKKRYINFMNECSFDY